MKTRASILTLLGLLTLALMSPPALLAQKGSFELGIGTGLTTLDDKLGGDTGGSLDFRAGYFVSDRFELEIQSSYASSILEGSFRAHTLNAVYHFDSIASDVVPYVLVGAGTADVEVDYLFVAGIEDNSTALRAAVGGRFEIGQAGGVFSRLEISALGEDSFEEDSTHIGITLLFGWNLGN